ncbi:unnamed protein product, partial [Ixodes hexagonus]
MRSLSWRALSSRSRVIWSRFPPILRMPGGIWGRCRFLGVGVPVGVPPREFQARHSQPHCDENAHLMSGGERDLELDCMRRPMDTVPPIPLEPEGGPLYIPCGSREEPGIAMEPDRWRR